MTKQSDDDLQFHDMGLDDRLLKRGRSKRGTKRMTKPRWPCGICQADTTTGSVFCGCCGAWVHQKCDDLSTEEFKALDDVKDDYICVKCTEQGTGSFSFSYGLDRLTMASLKKSDKVQSAVRLERILLRRNPVFSPSETVPIHTTDTITKSILAEIREPATTIPIRVSPDGNCLFNSLSVVMTGSELYATELRFRTCLEMMEQSDYYRAKWENSDVHKVSPNYFDAAAACCTNGKYSSAWTMMAASAVIQRDITSVYPPVNGLMDKNIGYLNQKFASRVKTTRKESVRIMWTSSSITGAKKRNDWIPDHFVPLIQGKDVNKSSYAEVNSSPEKEIPVKSQHSKPVVVKTEKTTPRPTKRTYAEVASPDPSPKNASPEIQTPIIKRPKVRFPSPAEIASPMPTKPTKMTCHSTPVIDKVEDLECDITSIPHPSRQRDVTDIANEAIAALGWRYPTAIQEKMIPLALEGKDVLARARTGSGKTAAYCIPLIQKILHSKQLDIRDSEPVIPVTATEQVISAVILTPSKELCSQAYRNIAEVSSCCSREIRCVDISPHVPLFQQRPQLMENPDIVIGTPTRILAHIKAGNISIKDSLTTLVIDEADLVFSFGYEDDIKNLLSELPKIYQALMMSATMTEELQALKRMVLHNPVILKLRESQLPEASQLAQYHIKCEEEDKFTLIYALLKLRLIRGKSIIFVNSVDRCYRVKLFLQQFVIRSCILNSELPVNSRCHIVNQFNDGLYDTIIASDERMLFDPEDKPQNQRKGKKTTRKKDKEYGVSRGIDFQNVSNVINFDFPTTVDAYIHRVGRTARGDSHGTALSFVSLKEQKLLDEVENTLKDTYSEGSTVFRPFQFRMEEIDGFRYRAKDMMRAVTRVAVKETRLKEIKQELLNSKKLQSHFDDNPRDLQVLRHDKVMHTPKSQQHLGNVPDYLVPPTLRSLTSNVKKSKQGKISKTSTPAVSKGAIKYQKRKADPLKSFEFAGISKKKKKS